MTPPPPPTDLTLAETGSGTFRALFARFLTRTVNDLMRLPLMRVPAHLRADHSALVGLLQRLATHDPRLPSALLRRPNVSQLARAALLVDVPNGDAALPGRAYAALWPTLMLEAAVAGVLPQDGVTWNHAPERLLSLASRLALVPSPEVRALHFATGHVTASTSQGTFELDLTRAAGPSHVQPPDAPLRVERPFHAIGDVLPGTVLALADANPLADYELHPHKDGNAIDLGGRDVTEWTSALAAACSLIETHLPALADEMRVGLAQFVPVGYDADKHLSASYEHDIGTVYLTLHPNVMTMTEAVIHEYQHNKLNTLLNLDAVLDNADAPLFKSPVRPDPRPLRGVLLAVHAFLPVAELYRRMAAEGHPLAQSAYFAERFRQIQTVNREGCDVLLPNARPTPVGRALLDEMARLDRGFGRG